MDGGSGEREQWMEGVENESNGWREWRTRAMDGGSGEREQWMEGVENESNGWREWRTRAMDGGSGEREQWMEGVEAVGGDGSEEEGKTRIDGHVINPGLQGKTTTTHNNVVYLHYLRRYTLRRYNSLLWTHLYPSKCPYLAGVLHRKDRHGGLERQAWWAGEIGMVGWRDRHGGLERQAWWAGETGMVGWRDRHAGLEKFI